MSTETPRRKLIEVALPLDAINAASAKEKSIRHGHPSTLHLWWARRPLAACRAVLFAQLVDDPSAHPDKFPTVEAQDAERQRLFGILEDLVRWDNTTNQRVLEAARAEIRASFDGEPPPVLDPFAGGGSIPLEAQRLGLEAHASDLNPVAVLINKALIELPPRFADQAPVHPQAEARTRWHGAQGLAEDVRRYGAWMRDQAQARIGHHYPSATLADGTEATVIAWIWARTVRCANPACAATMPLVRSFWLGKKKHKEAWARAIPNGHGGVGFEIGHDPDGPPLEGTVGRTGATCITCRETTPLAHIRAEGQAGRMAAQLMATVAQGDRRRTYLAPTPDHENAANIDRPTDIPDTQLPDQALGFRVQAYGMTRHADLFTNRQLTALTTLTDLVTETRQRAADDARTAGLSEDQASAYADAIATYLGFAISKETDFLSTIATWSSATKMEQIRNAFTRQAIPMTWDYGEANVFGTSAGSFTGQTDSIARVLEHLAPRSGGTAAHLGSSLTGAGGSLVATDPPYYDNIGYADLADFFYVWLRRSLRDVHPELFATMVTPKADELVADPFRFDGDKDEAKAFFEEGFVATFANARHHHAADVPLTLFYAFRQSETGGTDGLASTGWETLLGGLLEAGWSVTATWPMRTERGQRMRSQASNALASSVVLACRPRPETAGVTDRRSFLQALKSELPGSLRAMQAANIAPVDLPQAAIGPGMAVFSRYAKVVEPTGDAMRVRTALGLINEALAEVLDEQEGDFDADTRWAIKWFDQHGHQPGPSGEAEGLCTAYNTSLIGLVDAGILEARGGQTRLLARDELPSDWDPATDARVPVWEATQHLVKRLEDGGDQAAAALIRQLDGGVAESARLLAYRLFNLCERSERPKLAGPYNALAVAWPELEAIAAETPDPVQGTFGG